MHCVVEWQGVSQPILADDPVNLTACGPQPSTVHDHGRQTSIIPNALASLWLLTFALYPTSTKGATMSNGKKTPMTQTAQRRIQSAVDRTPNPTHQQRAFKAKTASVVAKRPSK